MEFKDIFLRTKQDDLESGVKYWKGRTYKPVFRDFLKYHIYKVLSLFPRKNAILVQGCRMNSFLTENTKNFHVISMEKGMFTVKELFKNHIELMPVNYWFHRLLYTVGKDDKKAEKYIDTMARMLKRMNIQALVVVDFFSAFQKSMSCAATRAGVPVVYYEHCTGLHATTSGMYGAYGDVAFIKEFADYHWFWRKKNMMDMISYGLSDPDKSYVVGYPYYFSIRNGIPDDRKSVLFLGSGVQQQKTTFEGAEFFYETVKETYRFCKENGIRFVYRPHCDCGNYYDGLSEIGIKNSENTCKEDLENYYIVIGGNTSVVLEAGMYNDFVIQFVWNYEMVEPYFYEHTYKANNAEEIKELINKAISKELTPRELLPDDLTYDDLAGHTKEAMDKIKEDRHKSAK